MDKSQVLFEEYKLFIEDTARLSERRQTAANTYVTVNGAIIGFITYLVASADLNSWWFSLAVAPIVVAAFMVCVFWRQSIQKYKALINLRFKVLREIEEKIEGSSKVIHREDELYPQNLGSNKRNIKSLNISDLESRLPTLFSALYLILGLGLVMATALMTAK